MIKVLITDKLAQEGIDLLNSKDGVEAVVRTGIDKDELARIIGEHDGLIIRSGTRVTPEVLANPGKLKGIARAGVGVDNIDIPEATRKGIMMTIIPKMIRDKSADCLRCIRSLQLQRNYPNYTTLYLVIT